MAKGSWRGGSSRGYCIVATSGGTAGDFHSGTTAAQDLPDGMREGGGGNKAGRERGTYS